MNNDNRKNVSKSVLSENKNIENVEPKSAALNKREYPSSMDKHEPLCIESKSRFVLFPIVNHKVCILYICF